MSSMLLHSALNNFHLNPSTVLVYRVASVQYNEMSRLTDSAHGDAVLAFPCCIAAGCSPVEEEEILVFFRKS